MKKVACLLLMLVMTLTVVCGAAEKSAIEKLNALERNVFDALLIMLNDFKDPPSVRIMELKEVQTWASLRRAYLAGEEVDGRPDSVCVRLTGNNSFGGKGNSYFVLCCYTWNEEPRTESGKSYDSLMKRLGNKNFDYTGTAGDYYEVDKPSGYFEISPSTEKAYIGNINRALKEHWEMLGF